MSSSDSPAQTETPKSLNRSYSTIEEFTSTASLAKRIEVSARILAKYSSRRPVILIGRGVSKSKFLIPAHERFDVVRQELRKALPQSIGATKAVFFYVNGVMLTNQLMDTLYESYKAEDGFLYVTFGLENTFG